jgi:hypothetical protein
MDAPDPQRYPLSNHFLSGYLAKKDVDPTNFPCEQIPGIYDRYENLFRSALDVLGLAKENLKHRSDFNFDSGDANNLEGGIAMLRVVLALDRLEFSNITLIPSQKGKDADIACERRGHRVCVEVKAMTKVSNGRDGLFLEEQLRSKIAESIPRAKTQLQASVKAGECSCGILACVVNWLDQSLCLGSDDYKHILDGLDWERGIEDAELSMETVINGVLMVPKLGNAELFLSDKTGKHLDD